MDIHLNHVGKKFNREWLFKDINLSFTQGSSHAIIGPNGCGKSTFIQLIAGNQLASSGLIHYASSEKGKIPAEEVYKEMVITAPYLELIEEFTLSEAINFHFKFKELREGVTCEDLIEIGYFEGAQNKYIRNFSSGMKQRLKLLLAFYSRASLVLLDEPTTNLDKTGVDWYQAQVNLLKNALILVASNQSHEYEFCNSQLVLEKFKP